jgi:hypothetical protein
MPTPTAVISSLLTLLTLRDCAQIPWWKHAAIEAVGRGHYIVIPGRQDTDAYLARYWLTPPKKDEDGYSSAESIVLHQFIRGDDDGALHNHPYDFVTAILNGGYDEVVGPPASSGFYRDVDGHAREQRAIGPAEALWTTIARRAGDRISKRYSEVHMATNPLPDTWTLVQTGVRCNDWGFYPPGKPFVPWKKFVQHTTVVGGRS